MLESFRHQIDRAIAARGVAVQAVYSQHPYDTPFAYTIGRHLRGQPELVAFGGTLQGTTGVLDELALDRPSGVVRAGAELACRALGGAPVRLVVARPEWTIDHARGAYGHADVPPWDLPVLQVVLPDQLGRLPGHDGRPDVCACCPDLSREDRPWALPFRSCDRFGLPGVAFASEPLAPDEVEVSVPARILDADAQRSDLVRARWVDDRVVELRQPPVISDWTTSGAWLEIDGDDHGSPIAAREIRPAPKLHLCWALDLQPDLCLEHQDGFDLELLDRLAGMADVDITLDPRWLAVATPVRQAPRVRSLLRRLARDGHATEASPFHRPAHADHPGMLRA